MENNPLSFEIVNLSDINRIPGITFNISGCGLFLGQCIQPPTGGSIGCSIMLGKCH
ncbi:MAG: hypothetical protein RRY15_05065 [Bacteroidales bacterium]